tara:strand:- start:191 stop:877 length:687 start_codon:yes stop_codon:yes gene_type:complete
MNPRFTPTDSIEFKDYLQESFEERLVEYNTLMGDMSFESDLAVEKKLVKKTSEAINIEPFLDIIEMGLEIPDDVVIMHKGKVEACFVAMASGWNPKNVKGMTLSEVHEPVADGETLRKASDGIWRVMTSGKSFHRHTWAISSLKKLSNHPHYKRPEIKSLDDLTFRVEHERTLTVDNDTAAFFIDVQRFPLNFVLERNGGVLKRCINSMSEEVLEYKNLVEVKELLNV